MEPGEKLKIDTLQRDHGLSSSPLREALNRLVTEGLVHTDERRGFWAAPVSVADLRDVTRLRLMLDCEALEESMRHGDHAWEARIVSALHWLVYFQKIFFYLRQLPDLFKRAGHNDLHFSICLVKFYVNEAIFV